MSNIVGNRHSTPEAANSLRPPNQRSSASGHLLRASADMSNIGASSPLSGRNIRPASEVYINSQGQNGDDIDAGQKWISEIDTFETTLEEMAAATVDQDFKDELSAIEQWFKVLTEAERTAALYALLQQTTQVQIRFFIQVLKEMSKAHPSLGALSPANFGEKDPMANRMSDASGKLAVAGTRDSLGPSSPVSKRFSGLPQETINAMFPAAASAIATQRAEYQRETGNNPPASNRNSAAFKPGERSSLLAPSASADQGKDSNAAAQTPASPWGQKAKAADKPIPSPMGQFAQPLPSAGLRSQRPAALNATALHGAEGGIQGTDLPIMSPAGVGSWASMTNTPMVANFSQVANQNDMLASATAMKLAALSTVNNRVMLDDARKFRRARSNEGGQAQAGGMPMSPGMPNNGNVVLLNESGQFVPVSPQQMQVLQLQQQQQAQLLQQARSRPNSPGMALRSPGMAQASPMFASPQANGFLAAYDGGLNTGMSNMSLGSYALGTGNSFDDNERGRSPRGRRGSSKPPEDPTDPALLKDIPSWLRMLRLHKYTDCLKDIKWQDLIQLDEQQLEAKGVGALGARRKLIKAFENVKEAQAAGKLS